MISRQEFELYQRAAQQGYAGAQCRLGDCYKSGDGVQINERKATRLYKKAARQGHAGALCRLGDIYKKRNMDEHAFRNYRRAARLCHLIALHKLALCYYHGEGVEEDDGIAFMLLIIAARTGSPNAQ